MKLFSNVKKSKAIRRWQFWVMIPVFSVILTVFLCVAIPFFVLGVIADVFNKLFDAADSVLSHEKIDRSVKALIHWGCVGK